MKRLPAHDSPKTLLPENDSSDSENQSDVYVQQHDDSKVNDQSNGNDNEGQVVLNDVQNNGNDDKQVQNNENDDAYVVLDAVQNHQNDDGQDVLNAVQNNENNDGQDVLNAVQNNENSDGVYDVTLQQETTNEEGMHVLLIFYSNRMVFFLILVVFFSRQ